MGDPGHILWNLCIENGNRFPESCRLDKVLGPIYRAIASRHLPFEGTAMLHFDSHPDLQIDTEMPANTVFDKQELLNTLSIENWIMPAVYAGHLSHVTWVKPPWADQLPVGSRKIKVGKHKTSEKMRINWPDSYFVSDVLYAPEEDLDHVKAAMIDVVTMETSCLKTLDFSNSIPVSISDLSRTSAECDTAPGTERKPEQPRILNLEIAETQCNDKGTYSCQVRTSTTPESCEFASAINIHGEHSIHLESLSPNSKLKQPNRSMRDSMLQNCAESHHSGNNSSANFSVEGPGNHDGQLSDDQGQQTVEGNDGSGERDHKHHENANESKHEVADCIDANLSSTGQQQMKTKASSVAMVTGDDVVKQFSEFEERFILDIDLDFFSTRNPFKEMYSKEQYELLSELYQFDGPQDTSEEALQLCQTKRAQQISELSESLKAAFSGHTYVPSCGSKERFQKVEWLVQSLKASPDLEQECVDPEMVHMAGLTCDDSGELPHHVSSEDEINSLLVAMETWLAKMPPPTIVTIARSSHDDYCPAHQVDGIQQRVLKMLQSLYDKLDVHLQYQTD